MNLKSKKILYLVEGETEIHFIDTIKGKFIIAGRTRKFNLWEKDVSNLIREISKGTIVICVLDTDITNETLERRLKNNIEKLKRNYKVIIINQNKNLEDEIVFCTSLTNIRDMYGCVDDKHKSAFINDKLLETRLENLEFDIEKLWQNSTHNIKKDLT